MQITMTFTAESGEDLRQQMLNFLGVGNFLGAGKSIPGIEFPVTEPAARVQEVSAEVKQDVPVKGEKLRKKSPVISPTQVSQEAVSPEPQGSGGSGPISRADDAPGAGTPTQIPSRPVDQENSIPGIDLPEQEVVTPPKEALELKEKVIDALQAAFRAGKVQKVRSVLTQYGNGAKSFREIDIAAFPEIDKALQLGALN